MSRALSRFSGPAPLPRAFALVCLILAALNLVGALGGGLLRLGWGALPAPLAAQALQGHGALMMAGFFGSLIALERALALRRGMGVPLSAACAGLLALAGFWAWAGWLWLLAAVGLLGLYVWAAYSRARSLPLAVEASGALALVWAAAAFVLGAPEQSRWGWSLFLLLTIVGERRELMRLRPLPGWAAQAFLLAWGVLGVAALLLMGPAPGLGAPLVWIIMGLLSLWLLAFDLARLQWRSNGWAGHTARCLLVGYVWLLAAALAGLWGQGGAGGIAWHLLWLGFVFSMVFAHAPIMLPALAGLRPRYSPWALLPLAVMGLSLLLRSTAVLAGHPNALAWAGAGHGVAVLGFGLIMGRLCSSTSA
ncbi:hypothetical protein [Roseateles koreensis]|uniref:NnrS family protein n=1 Tax=Roseateles koreensis TaxID=2987526 RepID=A0ABT5KTZ8_9BURK|nr:hypothetical protein [Roseateles koreensis]MDC8786420.1 hypothetical protein [Roseateles koreensis]